jgi:hypothetical protein
LRPTLSPDKITWIDLVNELVHASNDMDFGDIRIVSNEVVHFLIDTRKLTERWGSKYRRAFSGETPLKIDVFLLFCKVNQSIIHWLIFT